MRALVVAGIAMGLMTGLITGPVRAETDFSYGTGPGSYAPGGTTSYGVGSGAYAPGAGGIAPRYGAPGSAGSGFRVPSAPGVPSAPLPAVGSGRVVGTPGGRAGADPFSPAPIDTGIARRAPRGAPATAPDPFAVAPGPVRTGTGVDPGTAGLTPPGTGRR